mgnify:CR=1 FL=1
MNIREMIEALKDIQSDHDGDIDVVINTQLVSDVTFTYSFVHQSVVAEIR